MGLFDRFRRVVRSNINDMISKAEDPEKMLNELIIEMNQQLIESKKGVASAIADEKRLERQANDQRAKANEWEQKAMLALRHAEAEPEKQTYYEDLARQALVRKQEQDTAANEYEEQWRAQHESVEKLKGALRSLQQKIEEAQRKKNLLIARAKRAEAQKRIQKQISGISETSAFEVFDRMSRRVDELEAEADAMEDMELIGSDSDGSLESEFQKLEGSSASSDRLLEDLKRKMALSSAAGSSSTQSTASAGNGSTGPADETLDELKRKMEQQGGEQ